eukprot:scaffold117728_cov20-Tisochrysis_lutea.AAC.1
MADPVASQGHPFQNIPCKPSWRPPCSFPWVPRVAQGSPRMVEPGCPLLPQCRLTWRPSCSGSWTRRALASSMCLATAWCRASWRRGSPWSSCCVGHRGPVMFVR